MSNYQHAIAVLIEDIFQKQKEQKVLLCALTVRRFMDSEKVTINDHTYKKLKKAYQKATKERATFFDFEFPEGKRLVVTTYAKYMLEFLKPKFERG